MLRLVLLVTAGLSAAMAAWTFLTGRPTLLEIGDTRVFRNSSVFRPAAAFAVVAIAADHAKSAASLAAILLILVLLPADAVRQELRALAQTSQPLRAARDCFAALQATGEAAPGGVYASDPAVVGHSPFYYFRRVGPWAMGPHGWEAEARYRVARAQTPVIVGRDQWEVIESGTIADLGRSSALAAVSLEPSSLLLLPGGYAACRGAIVASGGKGYDIGR